MQHAQKSEEGNRPAKKWHYILRLPNMKSIFLKKAIFTLGNNAYFVPKSCICLFHSDKRRYAYFYVSRPTPKTFKHENKVCIFDEKQMKYRFSNCHDFLEYLFHEFGIL